MPHAVELTDITAKSRFFSEPELAECLTILASGSPVGDGPYADGEMKKTKSKSGRVTEASEGERTARQLASHLRQHLMVRSNGRYVESRGENKGAGITLGTKVYQDADGNWHYAVYERQTTNQ